MCPDSTPEELEVLGMIDGDPTNGEIPSMKGVNLHRVLPEQLEAKWESEVLPAVRVGLGSRAHSAAAIEGAYYALKQDVLRAYLIVGHMREDPAKVAILGCLIVGRNIDAISNERTLHIWSLFANGSLGLSDWRTGMDALARVKREMGCSTVTAQTNNKKLGELVKALGGSVEAVLLRLEV